MICFRWFPTLDIGWDQKRHLWKTPCTEANLYFPRLNQAPLLAQNLLWQKAISTPGVSSVKTFLPKLWVVATMDWARGIFFSTHRNWSIMRRNTPHHWASKGNKHWWIGAHADSSHRNILLYHYVSLCEWSHKKTNCGIDSPNNSTSKRQCFRLSILSNYCY